jgi:hypothetical protein
VEATFLRGMGSFAIKSVNKNKAGERKEFGYLFQVSQKEEPP